MIVLAMLLLQNADPIVIAEPYPAKEQVRHHSFDCGVVSVDVSASQSGHLVSGHLAARHGGQLIPHRDVQTDLFDRLSHLGGISVSCDGPQTTSFTLLVGGVSPDGSEVDLLYRVRYTAAGGFSEAVRAD